jgi:hypothetical protein
MVIHTRAEMVHPRQDTDPTAPTLFVEANGMVAPSALPQKEDEPARSHDKEPRG